jgi:hypothetical protein
MAVKFRLRRPIWRRDGAKVSFPVPAGTSGLLSSCDCGAILLHSMLGATNSLQYVISFIFDCPGAVPVLSPLVGRAAYGGSLPKLSTALNTRGCSGARVQS